MIRFLRLAFYLFAVTILIISCSQDPTSVGSELISQNEKISFQELDSYQANILQKSANYQDKIKFGLSNVVLIGKNSYAESSILMRYRIYMPDTLLALVKSGQYIVKSATMQMIPRYLLGDKTATLDFSVYQVRSDWSPVGFDRDSIPRLAYDPIDVSSGLTVNDTLVKFNLKNDVVTQWLKYSADSNSAPKNFGLLLKPKPSTKKIVGFYSAIPSSSKNETVLSVVLERLSIRKDTVGVSPFFHIYYLTGQVPQQNSNLTFQGGIGLKGTLFFDLNTLPKNIIVNKAFLELNVDTTSTLDGNPSSDSLYAQILADSTTKKLTRDSTVVTALAKKDKIYSGDVAWMVQKWQNGESNQGILLSLWDEYSSAARIAFYGSKNLNKALRPKLKIIYMQKK
ncbi:MAG: hypothetical protein WC879_06325 [Melioribacteraceae bacterium]